MSKAGCLLIPQNGIVKKDVFLTKIWQEAERYSTKKAGSVNLENSTLVQLVGLQGPLSLDIVIAQILIVGLFLLDTC